MKFENTEVWGFEHALRGMRNPKESWDKSDSLFDGNPHCEICIYRQANLRGEDWCCDDAVCPDFFIGPNDFKLAQSLIKAGSEHRKFLRQIFVSVDITAPLYWWKEFDTYKVGTTANSTSTMHKLTSKPITMKCFETDDLIDDDLLYDEEAEFSVPTSLIPYLESLRKEYLNAVDRANKTVNTDEKKYHQGYAKSCWKELIRWLPESWLQTRTVTMDYENIYSMIRQRRNHKLNEWSGKDYSDKPNFISWTRTLPYANELLFFGLDDKEETDKNKSDREIPVIDPIIHKIEFTEAEFDSVNHPSHYASGNIECIDAMESAYGREAVKNYCKCNAFKYQWRFDKKNGAEDIRKAQWYQDKYLELSE